MIHKTIGLEEKEGIGRECIYRPDGCHCACDWPALLIVILASPLDLDVTIPILLLSHVPGSI